jgi:glycosyltransferase involved in cell wall biosynthesis
MNNLHSTGKLPQVHVIYEYGPDYRPYSSSFLRLIRPLTHPRIKDRLSISFGLDYNNEPADLVILDRLWRPDVTLELVQQLVNKVRMKGSRFVYSLDDNYFDLPLGEHAAHKEGFLPIVTFLLRQADAVLVTTPKLSERLQEYNPNIHILPNQLDERLLVIRPPGPPASKTSHTPLVVGYMGTFTHDDDFKMILSALQSINQRYSGQLQFQVVGVVKDEATRAELQSLPLRFVYPRREEHEYPLFMPWFTGSVQWDIAISPLEENAFNACKSDIKFLDYASIGAPGIYSQSPAYSSTVQHNQNGWLAENTRNAWEEALSTLIEDAPLRFDLARNAHNYLFKQRVLAQCASDWFETLGSMLR